jgi:NleD-like pathogen effector protein (putative zinc metallopeptidase)
LRRGLPGSVLKCFLSELLFLIEARDMFQFMNYPIHVVYSLHRQQAVDPIANEASRDMLRARESAVEGLRKLDLGRLQRQVGQYFEKSALYDATHDWSLMEDITPKYSGEIKAYEDQVRRLLGNINGTTIGQTLLRYIQNSPGKSKVWIVPANWTVPKAITYGYNFEGEGIRIHINPKSFGAEAEDTLFHELVHAKRYAWNEYYRNTFDSAEINGDFSSSSEEFLATQLENVYHSTRGFSDSYSGYNGGSKKKKEMYSYLAENVDLTIALKYFLDNDAFVKEVAEYKRAEYNPFRDFEQIRKAAGIDPGFMKSYWKKGPA